VRLKSLRFKTPLLAAEVDDADWDAQSPVTLLWMLQQLLLIRRFEETLLELSEQGLVHGPVHASIGQEGVAVGTAMALRPADSFAGTHRAHHHYLAKALRHGAGTDYNPLERGLSEAMCEHVFVLLQEVMGLAGGCCGGRGGSMHLRNPEIGILGTNAIVGGGVPIATGFAGADRFAGRDHVTVCFFGDGALYQGVMHEAANLASLWKAPIVFAIENNRYAVGTSSQAGCSAATLCQVASAYDLPGFRVDGMDPVAVKMCFEHIRGQGDAVLPCFVEIETYRHVHHAGRSPGSAYKYRRKAEESAWRKRDPLARTEQHLRRLGLVDDDALARLEENARRCMDEVVERCLEKSEAGGRSVPSRLWAAPESVAEGLRDETSLREARFVEQEDVACSREVRYSDAIAEVTGYHLEKDPGAFVLGEEVANLGGGAYGATKGLAERFPDRVRNTPITEGGFCGFACGAAMNGMRPIVELMFSSFGLVAADQLFNQIGQLRYIYGGHMDLPVVVRTRVATGLGYGAQHSMDPVALFSLFPGWRIFVPTTSFDYVGLFNAAMRINSPVLIVEHHSFYSCTGPLPAGPPEHLVAPCRARICRRGEKATVVTYGGMVPRAIAAADALAADEIDVEVIDLRTVDDAGLDYEMVGRSLRRTGILATVEEAPRCNSIGAKIARECEQRFFNWLDGPVTAVNALDVPIPASRPYEAYCLPDDDRILAAIRRAALRGA